MGIYDDIRGRVSAFLRPFSSAEAPRRSSSEFHDQDFSVLARLLPSDAMCIDVGANSGQSIRSIKQALPDARVHSFEPNPEFSETLSKAALGFKDVEVHMMGLGAAPTNVTFYIPTLNGVRYLEETTMRLASLEEPWVVQRFMDRGGRPSFEEFVAPIRRGDEFGFAPAMIKIDVEGVESEVVAGFRETITQYRPILLIENGDWTRLSPIIDSLGYRPMMPNETFTALVPFTGARTNTFYVHSSWKPR